MAKVVINLTDLQIAADLKNRVIITHMPIVPTKNIVARCNANNNFPKKVAIRQTLKCSYIK